MHRIINHCNYIINVFVSCLMCKMSNYKILNCYLDFYDYLDTSGKSTDYQQSDDRSDRSCREIRCIYEGDESGVSVYIKMMVSSAGDDEFQ